MYARTPIRLSSPRLPPPSYHSTPNLLTRQSVPLLPPQNKKNKAHTMMIYATPVATLIYFIRKSRLNLPEGISTLLGWPTVSASFLLLCLARFLFSFEKGKRLHRHVLAGLGPGGGRGGRFWTVGLVVLKNWVSEGLCFFLSLLLFLLLVGVG
ncbi:hypothetical protein F5144DRAFT_554870 [Chaetomium tenue]|uniref:Uncharacterized protein n=1 Tax=Chaetomium tenue TaxID=1854479 RepID=A0ACB7PPT4_9PEZI|nr:hypothetical protein F5144DRAFT_554870 [Chaetomium globosum]